MPAITITGIKGISLAMGALGERINTIADRTITPIAQETKARLEQDTPVITGRLLRSTVVRKEGIGKQTLGQFAPYANIVNNRRGYWQSAITVSQKWPPFFAKTVGDEIGVLARQYGGQ